MRPSKHVVPQGPGGQEIFDISIARLGTGEKSVPVVATSEQKAITLFFWDAETGEWHNVPRPHADIAVNRDVPSISNTWNWSRHVGLVTFDDKIGLVYKRSAQSKAGQQANPPVLTLETFKIQGGFAVLDSSLAVPMPTYLVLGSHLHSALLPEQPGFELWAGVDLARRKLLIVTQTLGEFATATGGGANLKLLAGDLDKLEDSQSWQFTHLDSGGYGLDVRMQDDALFLVYRNQPESVTLPIPQSLPIDPFFNPAQFKLDVTPASDQFFTPVQLMRVDLATLATSQLTLPGGEHPRIQNVAPLLITVERPNIQPRIAPFRDAQGNFPAAIDWAIPSIQKLALAVSDTQQIARGLLLGHFDRNRPWFPRTAAPWISVQDLLELTSEQIKWASTWPRFPLEPLQLAPDKKGLSFDFLHKVPFVSLNRSRLDLAVDFEQGVLSASHFRSAIYDINHGEFGLPDFYQPDTTGENDQFAPFQRLSEASGNVTQLPAYVSDNTIGGSLICDREGVPFQFQAYTDLGDGGLRVIFDNGLKPPEAPPHALAPKTLDPADVLGPGSQDERWIELRTPELQDARVPEIVPSVDPGFLNDPNSVEPLLTVLRSPTFTSSLQAKIEALLIEGTQLHLAAPAPPDGWTEDQVNSIMSEINKLLKGSSSLLPAPPSLHDNGSPQAFINFQPANLPAESDTFWQAGIEGEQVSQVSWKFTIQEPLLTDVQPPLNLTGTNITVSFPFSGNWTVRVTITHSDGTTRDFEQPISIADSLFLLIESPRKGLSDAVGSFGGYSLGTAALTALQYSITFPVTGTNSAPHEVIIERNGKTDAQWQFLPDASRQGLIDYRLRLHFESQDIRLYGFISTLLKVDSISCDFFYGRNFTPGILMKDIRSANPLTGSEGASDSLNPFGERQFRLASAVTARPYSDAHVYVESNPKVQVSMLPQAIAGAVVTLLIGLGAAAAASTLTLLLAALGVAISMAGVTAVGGTVAVAAAVAVFLFINFAVPPIVEAAISAQIVNQLQSQDTLNKLGKSQLLQFAGEGIAESIARQVISKAIQQGANFAPPPDDPNQTGQDRYRQDIFQMIHVSQGRCRVLVREQ